MTSLQRCARCGRVVHPLAELAAVAKRGRKALDSMRLAVPDELVHSVRLLDEALPCLAGLCVPLSEGK